MHLKIWKYLGRTPNTATVADIEKGLALSSLSVTTPDQECNTKLPLHKAVENSDIEKVKKLITNLDLLNAKDDDGNTPLHLACMRGNVDIIEVLFRRNALDVNVINEKGQTPLYLALVQGNKNVIRLLLSRRNNIDLDSQKYDGKSCRDILEEKYPAMNLFCLLYQGKTKEFIDLAESNRSLLEENDGRDTFLQYACKKGFTDVAQTLLDLGTNPKAKGINNDSPLKIATFNACCKILDMLLKHPLVSVKEDEPDLIFEIFKGASTFIYFGDPDEDRDHLKCLNVLLKETSWGKLNINRRDSNGDTILHHAAYLIDEKYVSTILEYGASIGVTNNSGKHTLEFIKPWQLKKRLDNCIYANSELSRSSDYAIIFEYKSLVPLAKLKSSKDWFPENLSYISHETDPLLKMSTLPEFSELLTHPVLTSFLNLKWHTIRKIFYLNLFFYLGFWTVLTLYISCQYVSWSFNSDNDSSVTNTSSTYSPITTSIPNNTESSNDPRDSESFDRLRKIATYWLKIASLIFCAMFCSRELSQLLVSPLKYLTSWENWSEIFFIVITGVMLLFETPNNKELSALVILMSCTNGIFLIGKHPKLSIYVEMFKRVSVNFLKFLILYGVLVMAFAVSFCLLFSEGESKDSFMNPFLSIFKTIIMMTGEFDSSSIHFSSSPIVSRLVFVSFVFFVAVVLLSLLSGLAVNDIQVIRSDAEIVAIKYRIDLTSYSERMALFDLLWKMEHSLRKLLRRIDYWPRRKETDISGWYCFNSVDLFPNVLQNYTAAVYPNHDYAISFVNNFHFKEDESTITCYFRRCLGWRMASDIAKAAQAIINERLNDSGKVILEDLVKFTYETIVKYEPKLETVERSEEKLTKCVEQLQAVEQISQRNEQLLMTIVDGLQRK